VLDRPSRLLLAVVSALIAFALTGILLDGSSTDGGVAMADDLDRIAPLDVVEDAAEAIPAFALQPALPRDAAAGTDDDEPPPPPLTIAFAGDVHGEAPVSQVLDRGDNPLAGMADVLAAADLAVVNLETAVGTAGTRADKTFTFRADAALLTALVDAGVDVVSLANNHGLDFGVEGADRTRALAEDAGLAVVGYGRDRDDAYAPHVVDVDGRTVAVVGLTRVMPVLEWGAGATRPGMASAYDVEAAAAAVRDAARIADHVVVTIHWGQERWVCPNAHQQVLARVLVDAGADAVVGHHPHVLQGVVEVDESLVAYSLGNFVFYARTPATRQTGVLTITLGDGPAPTHRWSPAVIDGEGSPQPVASQAPMPATGEELIAPSSGPECGPPA
jgi:poly-gamma-glutamate capsule biosynthesis protein CapA/YwtB (metallophosphatase superfamily)